MSCASVNTCRMLRKSSSFVDMLNLLKWYLTGILVTLFITESGKIVIGRLRPHFLDVCKPNFTSFDCFDSRGFPIYVNNYECFGDPKHVIDAR